MDSLITKYICTLYILNLNNWLH